MSTLYEVKFYDDLDQLLITRYLTEFPDVGDEFMINKMRRTVYSRNYERLSVDTVWSGAYNPVNPWHHGLPKRGVMIHDVKSVNPYQFEQFCADQEFKITNFDQIRRNDAIVASLVKQGFSSEQIAIVLYNLYSQSQDRILKMMQEQNPFFTIPK